MSMIRPVVVLGGWSNSPADLQGTLLVQRLRGALTADFVVLPAYADAWGDIDANAGAAADAIRGSLDALANAKRISARHFDVVGYGMGGLVARAMMLRFGDRLGGYRARNLVTIGTPHTGIDALLAGFGDDVGFGSAAGRSATARTQMTPGSAYLAALNLMPLPPHVLVTTVGGSARFVEYIALPWPWPFPFPPAPPPIVLPAAPVESDGLVPSARARIDDRAAASIVSQHRLLDAYYSAGVRDRLVGPPNPKGLAGRTGTPLPGTPYLDDPRVADIVVRRLSQPTVLECRLIASNGNFVVRDAASTGLRATGSNGQDPAAWFTLIDRNAGLLATGSPINLIAASGHYVTVEQDAAHLGQVTANRLVPGDWERLTVSHVSGTPPAVDNGEVPDDGSLALADVRGRFVGVSTGAAAALSASAAAVGAPEVVRLDVIRNLSAELPFTGMKVRQLAGLDYMMRWFMKERGIPCGTLAVMKEDRVVLARGYGYLDRERTRLTIPSTPMRLASNDKPLSAAAMRVLAAQNLTPPGATAAFGLGTLVFPLVRASYNIQPFTVDENGNPIPNGGIRDARVDDITIQHLLDHRAGLPGKDDASIRGHLQQLGITRPFTPRELVRWFMTRGLEFDPDSAYRYSNEAADLLRIVIDIITGNLIAFMRTNVLAQAGASDVDLARGRPALRSPREPWYSSRNLVANIWDRASTEPIPGPDAMNLDSLLCLTATAESMVRFMRRYLMTDESSDPMVDAAGNYAPPNNGWNAKSGGFDGTATFSIQRRWDQVSVCALFNQGFDNEAEYDWFDAIYECLNEAVDDVTTWP